jgi:hypothetical protein
VTKQLLDFGNGQFFGWLHQLLARHLRTNNARRLIAQSLDHQFDDALHLRTTHERVLDPQSLDHLRDVAFHLDAKIGSHHYKP